MDDHSVVLGRVGSVFGDLLGPDPFGGGGAAVPPPNATTTTETGTRPSEPPPPPGPDSRYGAPEVSEGYPAVIHDETDSRPKGICNLAVGISQTLAFRVGEYGRLKEKSCDRAVTVAAAVLRTLKGGA